MEILKFIYKKIINYKYLLLGTVETFNSSYLSFHLRPKSSKQMGIWPDNLKIYPKVGIIIQGPLLQTENFTLETIRIYKKIFGHYQVILSIWEDEKKDLVEEIRKEGIEIILNKKPDIAGISNINYQITSTINAIGRGKDMRLDYILKTRTDLRLYNPNAIEFLVNLLDSFPAATESKQKKRIAVPSLNTFKYRPYSITDLLMFGDIDDMLEYWGIELDTRKVLSPHDLVGEWSRTQLCEVYLSTKYLQNLGQNLSWTIEDSWEKYAKYFCIFDSQSLDLYWYKYLREYEYRRLEYSKMRNDQELSFGEWLNLYSGKDNKKDIPENILQTTFGEIIKNDKFN